MTHDELRDYIDKFDAAGMIDEPLVKAVRAVVELHKPLKFSRYCAYCVPKENYPCETIKVIEKELS